MEAGATLRSCAQAVAPDTLRRTTPTSRGASVAKRAKGEPRLAATDPVGLEEGKDQESSGCRRGRTVSPTVTDAGLEKSSEVARDASRQRTTREQWPSRGGTADPAGKALKVKEACGRKWCERSPRDDSGMKPLRERETPRAEGVGEANRRNDHCIDFAERQRTPWKVSRDSAMVGSLCLPQFRRNSGRARRSLVLASVAARSGRNGGRMSDRAPRALGTTCRLVIDLPRCATQTGHGREHRDPLRESGAFGTRSAARTPAMVW